MDMVHLSSHLQRPMPLLETERMGLTTRSGLERHMAAEIVPTRCVLCKDKAFDLTHAKRPLRCNLLGQRYGRLVVQHFVGMGMHSHHGAYWCCLCDCGIPRIARGDKMTHGDLQSCGCLRSETSREKLKHALQVLAETLPSYGNLVGERFGRLVVQRWAYSQSERRYWLCRCDCGQETTVSTGHLREGDVASCGCLQKELSSQRHRTHGMTDSRVYHSWRGILSRCYNPHGKAYQSYGGRGITVCERWRYSFENFYADMGDPPIGLTLERKDTNGQYSPENCVWATWQRQRINQRRTVYYTHNGETHHVQEWSVITGIHRSTLAYRINKLQWDIARALTTPVMQSRYS